MRVFVPLLALAAFSCSIHSSLADRPTSSELESPTESAKKSLAAFRAEAELDALFKKLKKDFRPSGGGGGGGGKEDEVVKVESDSVPLEESVTNVQHAGVDE